MTPTSHPNFRVTMMPPMEPRIIYWQKSSGSVFYASRLTVWWVVSPIWDLLSLHSHHFCPDFMQAPISEWCLPWKQGSHIDKTHQDQSFMHTDCLMPSQTHLRLLLLCSHHFYPDFISYSQLASQTLAELLWHLPWNQRTNLDKSHQDQSFMDPSWLSFINSYQAKQVLDFYGSF